ncbi:MAG: selenide, water dikinase SelD [Acidimicrobiia bacterium]|nr:selenide, water dikinase SelD [Acidimicrobiia bacterium]
MAQVLAPLTNAPVTHHPDLLVGLDTPDDAAVFRAPSGDLLVQTVDFFTPVVDDPFDWGRITAANALSDVYAMGGSPLTALQLVGWPRDDLGFDVLERVIAGGVEVMTAAGCTIVGGHSIDDREPKYGFAVTGIAPEGRVVTSAGAEAGDLLVLTKPLGTGIAATAIKRGLAPDGLIGLAVQTMASLNRTASDAMVAAGAHAATDVTGFGLLGHLAEMLDASSVGAELEYSAVPTLPGVELLAEDGVWPGGSERNLEAASEVDFGELPLAARRVLADAQTSGGLLVAVPPGAEGPLLEVGGVVIGTVTGEPGIRVR